MTKLNNDWLNAIHYGFIAILTIVNYYFILNENKLFIKFKFIFSIF